MREKEKKYEDKRISTGASAAVRRGCKYEKYGKKMNVRRCILYTLFGMLAFLLSACTSKENILLEEEDLVRTAAASGSDGYTDGISAEGWQEGTGQPDTAWAEEAGRQGEGLAEGPGQQDWAEQSGEAGQQEAAGQKQGMQPSTLFVHICGEVMEPGVYELPAGSRIFEAVKAAGGFTETASQSYVNLALELRDGWKVEIPALGEEPGVWPENTDGQEGLGGQDTEWKGSGGTAVSGMQGITGNMAGITEKPESTAEGSSNAQSQAGSQGNVPSDGLVDINTATKQELCTLPGIGETRAESIISYREKNGGFGKIEDIMKVEGIKEGMFSKMKDKICVRGVE